MSRRKRIIFHISTGKESHMKRRIKIKGDRVRGSKEFGIVDYKRCIAPEIMEKRIANHNRRVERDYQRYVVRGMCKYSE